LTRGYTLVAMTEPRTATEDHLNAAYVRVHDAGEKYQAAYLASLPTTPAAAVGLEIPVPQSDQGELDQMRADVKRFGAEYERIADELGLSQEDRLAWRHYLD
jgi:hypothetical protein